MATNDESFVRVIKVGDQELIVGKVPAAMAGENYRLVVRIEKSPRSAIQPKGLICGCDSKQCGCDSQETCGCDSRCGGDCAAQCSALNVA